LIYYPEKLYLEHLHIALTYLPFADAGQVCGAVSLMRWTPEGVALAIAWERGGFSVWSVFGSLLYHSMGVEAG
jgi:hypothetical protein